MKLYREPFQDIVNGDKDIEIRLNDKKRRRLKVDDVIEFSLISDLDKKIKVRVIGLTKYKSFADLYDKNDTKYFKGWDKDNFIARCYDIYSPENEKKYGALAIMIELQKS